MIGIDLDGTLLNYNNHVSQIRINPAFLETLRNMAPGDREIAIITNQGGMAFHARNPAKYPPPYQVAGRLSHAMRFLRNNGYTVAQIRVSAYHPQATPREIAAAARRLRQYLALALPEVQCVVHETARSRKPSPMMLRAAGVSCYLGDSPEDMAAAQNAGISGVPVARYQ